MFAKQLRASHITGFGTLSKALLSSLALALFSLFSMAAQAQYVHTRGTDILDGHGRKLVLKGTNLGNWLVPEGYMWHLDGGPQSYREIDALLKELIGPDRTRAFWTQYRDTYISRQDIYQIKAAGFNSIRIPLHWSLFMEDGSEGFRLIDRVIGWCRDEGLLVVLDLHAAPGGQTGTNIDDSYGYPWLFDDPGAQHQTIALWRRIAHHYRNEPVVMGYDLLNEPIPNYPDLIPLTPKLAPLQKRISDAIRSEDKHHAIILGGAQWDQNLKVYDRPWDANTIYEVHRYKTAPTQQGIADFLAQRTRLGAPIWMGETGENTDDWVRSFARVMEANDVGWCFWPYKKLDATTSPVTFNRPEGWDAIVAYAKLPRGSNDTKSRLPQRPSQAAIDNAVAGLLVNIRFENEHRNIGYIRALLPDTTLQP
jgi:endoglucanase